MIRAALRRARLGSVATVLPSEAPEIPLATPALIAAEAASELRTLTDVRGGSRVVGWAPRLCLGGYLGPVRGSHVSLTRSFGFSAQVLFHRGRLVILTGAGVSTESGVPDYRSPGRGEYRPMQHSEFVSSETIRHRYWARSAAGYRRLSAAWPNDAHRLVAALEGLREREGLGPTTLITQNVDGLHARAGSRAVLELHGTIHRVGCLECGVDLCRAELQAEMERVNGVGTGEMAPEGDGAEIDPGNAAVKPLRDREDRSRARGRDRVSSRDLQRPDGDTEIAAGDYAAFRVPKPCQRPSLLGGVEGSPSWGIIGPAVRSRKDWEAGEGAVEVAGAGEAAPVLNHADSVGSRPVRPSGRLVCSNKLMPRVVFHGGSLPRGVARQSVGVASAADAFLVLGSTLTVFSAFRLVKAAKENGASLAIVNHGTTRGDGLADAVIDAAIPAALRAAIDARLGASAAEAALAALEPPLPSPISVLEDRETGEEVPEMG